MKMTARLLALTAALLIIPFEAEATISSGTLKAVYLDQLYADRVFVQFSAATTRAPCATNPNVDYVLDISTATGKALYSVLLTAYAAQSAVMIGGFDTCVLGGGSVLAEDIRWVRAQS